MASIVRSENCVAQAAGDAASRQQLHVAEVTGWLHWGDYMQRRS
jgi:hypothetical protein